METTETKMNPEIKAKWLAALRSGEYVQGRARLRTVDNKFCCLGVLCDLHAKETGNAEQWKQSYDAPWFEYTRGRYGLPPKFVIDWASLPSVDPIVALEDRSGFRSVTMLNDSGFTFAEIADLIEAHL